MNMITLSGIGYDIHRFSETERPLVLGGITLHSTRGLEGHSDADVLCHAIADALLGAAALPDIGFWFPPSSADCKDICSLEIVAKAVSLIHAKGGRIHNIDSTVIAEAPKIGPHIDEMKQSLAAVLGISSERIGIKATTNERLGSIGREEGIAAFATCCISLPE